MLKSDCDSDLQQDRLAFHKEVITAYSLPGSPAPSNRLQRRQNLVLFFQGKLQWFLA